MRRLKEPPNVTDRYAFLGLCKVNRQFVSSFARVAAPLGAKQRKDQPTTSGSLSEDKLKSINLLEKCVNITTRPYASQHY